MDRLTYDDNQTVQTGGMDIENSDYVAADGVTAALTQGVYWLTPVTADCYIQKSTTSPATTPSAADGNTIIPYGNILPINVKTDEIIRTSAALFVTKAN